MARTRERLDLVVVERMKEMHDDNQHAPKKEIEIPW